MKRRIGLGPLVSQLHNWLTNGLKAPNIRKLREEKNTERLAQALEHSKPEIRWAAMRALGELSNVPALVNLGNDNLDVRAQAAEALGHLADPQTLKPLIASLRDPTIVQNNVRYTYPVRISAIEALGKIGDPSAIEPVLEALRKHSWGYPVKGNEPLYISLARMGEPILVPLISLLQDHDRTMRELAIFTLGYLGDRRAVKPLGDVLGREKDRLLKRAAMQALYRIGNEVAVPMLIEVSKWKKDPRVLSDLVSFLSRIQDDRVPPALVDVLRRVDPPARKSMVDDINRFGTLEARAAANSYQDSQSF